MTEQCEPLTLVRATTPEEPQKPAGRRRRVAPGAQRSAPPAAPGDPAGVISGRLRGDAGLRRDQLAQRAVVVHGPGPGRVLLPLAGVTGDEWSVVSGH